MNIVVLGVNNKTASVEVREQLAFRSEQLGGAMTLLKQREGVLECLILSTCNRVEIYSLLADVEPSILASFLCEYHGIGGSIDDSIYVHMNEDAIGHLCRVASGIDSMIVGEPQIFGQVKDAYRVALESGTAGVVFKSLFPQAFTLVKTVRAKNGIGRVNVSASSSAVSLVKSILESLNERTALILGAGEMGELTLRTLVKNGVRRIYVANRTFERAVRLAESFRGTPVMFQEIGEYLPSTDIIISSIDASAYVLRRNDIPARLTDKPLIAIDLSVPRSIDPIVKEMENVHLFNIDDLQDVIQKNLSVRESEAETATQIIDNKVKAIWRKLDSAELAPMIVSLKDMAERVRGEMFSSYVRDIGLSDRDKDLVELLTKSIANRIVHHAIVLVREYSNSLRYK